MPIYAYKCSACGHAQDVLQKMSDPLLTVCPECGQNTYVKQVTAAGFQLKGTGWYVTDFRDGGKSKGKDNGAGASKPHDGAPAGGPESGGAKADASVSGGAKPDAPAPATGAPAAPAAGGSSPPPAK